MGHLSISHMGKGWICPKGDAMTRVLFLLSPVIFSGLCLLVGETIGWVKQKRNESGIRKMMVVSNTRRK
jgi:hypothetical protein